MQAAAGHRFATSWPLGLDHSITVRAMRPEDIDLETEFAENLSEESRYRRFLSGMRLSAERLEQLTRVDFSRDMALIATVTIEGKETQIGVARYARLADGVTCEFAIAVADRWQGCGVGTRLLRELIDCAAASGIERVTGDVLSTNREMFAVARKLGFRTGPHPDGAALRRVELDLRAAGAGTPRPEAHSSYP